MTMKAGETRTSRLLYDIGLVSLGSTALLFACAHYVTDDAPSDEGIFLTSNTKLGTAAARTARISGVLHVDSGGCVRIGYYVVVWPQGYRAARWHPLEVRDDIGNVVARQGQTIEFGGGIAPAPGSSCTPGEAEAAYVQSQVATI
jgi:hypothetical protein